MVRHTIHRATGRHPRHPRQHPDRSCLPTRAIAQDTLLIGQAPPNLWIARITPIAALAQIVTGTTRARGKEPSARQWSSPMKPTLRTSGIQIFGISAQNYINHLVL